MKRKELMEAAKLLGLPASGKNDEIMARIEARLKEINAVLLPKPRKSPVNADTGVRLVAGRKLEDGRRGLHPITGKPIYS